MRTATRPANIFLLQAGVVCFLVWSYFLYYYVWTGERQFTGPAGIVLYIVVPGFLAALFLGSLRLKPAHRINLAIFCLVLIVSLDGTDLSLLVYDSNHFDTRTWSEVAQDLREQGVYAVPSVFAPALLEERKDGSRRSSVSIDGVEFLPFAGIANAVTVMCNESGKWITYTSDEHGFHNPEGTWKSRDIAIAAIGDSFAHGGCVPSDKNFASLIQRSYPTTVNLGIGGAGPLMELAIMKEYLPLFRPKVTLWFYYEGNDDSDLRKEKKSRLLARYLEDGFTQSLMGRQNEIDQALTLYIEAHRPFRVRSTVRKYFNYGTKIITLSELRQHLGLIYGTDNQELSQPEELQPRLLRDILRKAQALVRAWDGDLAFVYLPTWARYADPRSLGDNRDPVLALVKSLKIPVIDVDATFRAHGDPLSVFPYRRLGHYNEEGHRLVAEAVFDFVSHHHPAAPANG
jgi:hypothetical protein